MAINHTQAIVLKSFDYRETSKIVRFYTRDHGKVSGVLKGLRRDPKKFGSSVDQFSVNDIVYYEYRNSDLHLVSQCDMRGFFGPIREDIKRMNAAMYILELVDKIMPAEAANQAVYELMLRYLDSLQRARDINKLVYMFQIKVLSLSGFRPHLDSCVQTAQPIHGQARFSMKLGGLIAPGVRIKDDQAVPINPGTIASMLHIEQHDWDYCLRLALPKAIAEELRYILNHFLVFHLEKHIKSTRFLQPI